MINALSFSTKSENTEIWNEEEKSASSIDKSYSLSKTKGILYTKTNDQFKMMTGMTNKLKKFQEIWI